MTVSFRNLPLTQPVGAPKNLGVPTCSRCDLVPLLKTALFFESSDCSQIACFMAVFEHLGLYQYKPN